MENNPELSQPKTPAQYLRLLFTGFAMGAADIVPGVSGGTMAFILGVYQNLIDGIKSFNLDALRLLFSGQFGALFTHIPIRFLLTLGLGIGIAIVALANLLGSLLETAPTFVYAFFGGLVLASIVAVGLKVRWSFATGIALVVGAVGAFILVGLPALDPSNVSHTLPVLFVSGAIAICAMILPGISGSFILLILGQYQVVLDAVRNREIATLLAVGAGAVVGLLAFARVLSWLLKHHFDLTVALLTGFMIGSLRRVWLNAVDGTALIPDFRIGHVALAAGFVLIGFLLVSLFDHFQTGNNPVFAWMWRPERGGETATEQA